MPPFAFVCAQNSSTFFPIYFLEVCVLPVAQGLWVSQIFDPKDCPKIMSNGCDVSWPTKYKVLTNWEDNHLSSLCSSDTLKGGENMFWPQTA